MLFTSAGARRLQRVKMQKSDTEAATDAIRELSVQRSRLRRSSCLMPTARVANRVNDRNETLHVNYRGACSFKPRARALRRRRRSLPSPVAVSTSWGTVYEARFLLHRDSSPADLRGESRGRLTRAGGGGCLSIRMIVEIPGEKFTKAAICAFLRKGGFITVCGARDRA